VIGCPLKAQPESKKAAKRNRPTHVVIVGAGRVGQTIGRLLADRGYVIDGVVCRTRQETETARRFTRSRHAGTRIHRAILEAADIIFLTTPDRMLAGMADTLSGFKVNWGEKTVFHTSGAMTSQELAALKHAGARVASLHPLQTFPTPQDALRSTRGIFYTFEGGRTALPIARKVVLDLAGHLVPIKAKYKALYHCAGAFACAFLLAPLSAAYELYGKMGVDEKTARRMLAPMIYATLKVAQNSQIAKVMTGPLPRGDTRTIVEHLKALSAFAPHLVNLYGELSLRLLELQPSSLTASQRNTFRALFQKPAAMVPSRTRSSRQ
jgi:predicted short-subunit dehydrogenase-like oxidoreductase (DUF2520 family)